MASKRAKRAKSTPIYIKFRVLTPTWLIKYPINPKLLLEEDKVAVGVKAIYCVGLKIINKAYIRIKFSVYRKKPMAGWWYILREYTDFDVDDLINHLYAEDLLTISDKKELLKFIKENNELEWSE